MINKKEFLLESIIKAYIEHLEPIGSSQLKSMYDITYSPVTIRGYFKKLGDEGFLAQEHVSSGRTPTTEALKQYWQSKLDFKLSLIDIQAVENLAQKIGLTVFVKKRLPMFCNKSLKLKKIYDIGVFNVSHYCEILRCLVSFLSEMIGFEIVHIMNISKQVGAYEIYEKVNTFLQSRDFHIYNIKEFLSLCLHYNFDDASINLFLSGKIVEKCNEGLYFEELFPSEYIGIAHNCIIQGNESKLFVVGELSKDYEYFYNQISIV